MTDKPIHHPEFTELQRLNWYSKAVHAGRPMRHVEALRQSPRFAEMLSRVRKLKK